MLKSNLIIVLSCIDSTYKTFNSKTAKTAVLASTTLSTCTWQMIVKKNIKCIYLVYDTVTMFQYENKTESAMKSLIFFTIC